MKSKYALFVIALCAADGGEGGSNGGTGEGEGGDGDSDGEISGGIKEFATAEQFRTYDNFLLQRSLSLMNDVVRCPRSKCDSTCLVDNESLARCPKCHYTFCPQCLRLSHPGQSCPPPPEIPKVKKKPKRKPMKNNEEGGDDNEDEEDEEVNFIRYEEKEIPTLGSGLGLFKSLMLF
ncbi:hypothetical protein Aperf_G00000027453 [Anoplocephala perfoliata]